jgi:hypothetical protein
MENMMATAADKKKWDTLHAAYAKAREAESEYDRRLHSKYGRYESSWLTRTERAKIDALSDRSDKIGDKIVDLLVKISPRGDRWLSGVPSWWIREKLTWEDAIRPIDEPLSVVVPGSYGVPDGTVKETARRTRANHMENRNMSRTSKSIEEFAEFLDKAVILVAGEASSTVDPHGEEVHVAIVVNVTGYGPHTGAIFVDQNRFHASPDTALEGAFEELEEWEREHYPMSEEDEERRTETFDGRAWTLPALAFTEAIYNTKAEQFIDVLEDEDEPEEDEEGVLEESRVAEPNDARDILEGLGPYMKHEGHDAPRESARIARMIAGVRGDADRADKVLEEVNRLVDGHGVEAIRDEQVYDNYYGDVVALYVNMGDTYDTTLVYDTETHEFQVTSWGDWYEAYEAEQEDDEEGDD